MANLKEITVPISFEMTDTGKAFLRAQIAEILGEAADEAVHVHISASDEVRALIRAEVKRELTNMIRTIHMQPLSRSGELNTEEKE